MIVSSQAGVPTGSIGGADQIRQAFEQAKLGQLGRQLIPGTPERPVQLRLRLAPAPGHEIIGVLAVRVSLDDVEQAWALSKDTIFALDTDGRVVVSNMPDWRGKTLRKSWTSGATSPTCRPLKAWNLLLPATATSTRICNCS